MYGLGPGQAAHIYDYSADPRILLRLLAKPVRALRTEGVPLVHVRRGWLHGTHLVVTVRPLEPVPVSLEEFAAAAGRIAEGLAAEPPTERDYLARAEQLARWDGTTAPFLPLRPQGFASAGPAAVPDRWGPELLDARDLLTARLTESILASSAVPRAEILHHAARILALSARAHPYGIGIGTLPLRSHTEGIWSAVGGTTDLRATFTERFEQDRDLFGSALSGLDGAGDTGPEDAALRSWNEALNGCWGIASALTASGAVDESRLEVSPVPGDPLGTGVASTFHRTVRRSGLRDRQPYWHIAHRMLLNVLYSALGTLGVTPIQRYYLCFGISSAADALLGEDWSQRLERISKLSEGPAAV